MSLVGKIKTITGNSDYRVRDVVDKKGHGWEHSAQQVKCNPKYHGTILETYLKLVDQHKGISLPMSKLRQQPPHPKEIDHTLNTRSLLLRLIKERVNETGMTLPNENELVVHLRLGDIVGDIKWQRFAAQSGDTSTHRPEDVTVNLIEEYIAKHSKIDKITIITCFAYQDWSDEAKKAYRMKNPTGTKDLNLFGWTPEKHEYNNNYFQLVELSIKKRFPNLELGLRSSLTIDEDMCYASLANHFIPSLGGFTELLEELSIMNKNGSVKCLRCLPEGKLMKSIQYADEDKDFLSLNSTQTTDLKNLRKILVKEILPGKKVSTKKFLQSVKPNKTLPQNQTIQPKRTTSQKKPAQPTKKGNVGLALKELLPKKKPTKKGNVGLALQIC